MTENNQIELQVSFRPSKFVRVSNEYIEYDNKRINFKDATAVGWGGTKTTTDVIAVDMSFSFHVADDKTTILLPLRSSFTKSQKILGDTFNTLVAISNEYIEPVIIEKEIKKIKNGGTLKYGTLKLSNEGMRYRFFIKERFYVWADYSHAEIIKGTLHLYVKSKADSPLSAELKITQSNVVTLPQVLGACYEAFV